MDIDGIPSGRDSGAVDGERPLCQAIELIPIPAMLVAEDGEVLQINAALTQITGYGPADSDALRGLLTSAYRAYGPDLPSAITQCLDSGRSVQFPDLDIVTRQGEHRAWLYSAQHAGVLKDGRRVVIGVGEDVTELRRAEEALRKANLEQGIKLEVRTTRYTYLSNFLVAVLHNVQTAIIACNAEGVLTFYNRVARELFGMREATSIEQWAERVRLFHADGQTPLQKHEIPMIRALAGERVRDFEMIVSVADAEPRAMLVSGHAILTPAGRKSGAVMSLHDISQRRRAQSNLEFQKYALDQAAIVAITDGVGTITYANDKFCEISGYTRQELIGKNHRILSSGTHPKAFFVAMYRTISNGEVWRGEICNRRKDGALYWVDTTIVPSMKDGRAERYVAIRTDITVRKRAEEALRKTYAELERRVEERTGELAANAALKEGDQRKNEFLATLAHELRNPLAPIRNAVQVLNSRGPADPELQHAREIIDRQVTTLVRMVDDLLDVNRVARGKIVLCRENVDLVAVIQRAVEATSPNIVKMGHFIKVTLPPAPIWLHADGVRLEQVFSNLLNNACKYTDRGGHISVTAHFEGEQVAVNVRDTGIGIAADRLQDIFAIFSQVQSSVERSQGGLGIGLSLVKGLVELHDGTIEARSAGVGKGSEFIVRLPVLQERPIATQPHVEDSEILVPPRVLVVDDNFDSAESLAMLLSIKGSQVQQAHDGIEAVEQAERFEPDVILMDLGLPRLDGYETCRQIRSRPWGAHIPVIALTGWGTIEDMRRTAAAGFDAHLVKPVDSGVLLKTMTALLRQHVQH
jgi:PAS domain S-box-containing protein